MKNNVLTIFASIVVLCPADVLAQSWQNRAVIDKFTDETVWIANIDINANSRQFSLFANCRDSKQISVGLTGEDVRLSSDYVFVRFDSEEPSLWRFSNQRGTAYVTERITKKSHDYRFAEYVFVKRLSDSSRLRIQLPQYRASVILDFPLRGSKRSLLAMVEACGSEIPRSFWEKIEEPPRRLVEEETEAMEVFIDARGKRYARFVDMLRDDTWKMRQEK